MQINIQSSAFKNSETIPKAHTADGADLSPQLSWTGVPQEARELALIMDDPDAPTTDPWVHWVIYKIPADTINLPQGLVGEGQLEKPAGALQGKNSWDTVGYRGPAPPPGHGTHHYHFRLFALSEPLGLGQGVTKQQLLQAMEGHVLAQGELVGTYQR